MHFIHLFPFYIQFIKELDTVGLQRHWFGCNIVLVHCQLTLKHMFSRLWHNLLLLRLLELNFATRKFAQTCCRGKNDLEGSSLIVFFDALSQVERVVIVFSVSCTIVNPSGMKPDFNALPPFFICALRTLNTPWRRMTSRLHPVTSCVIWMVTW